jgi:hypothetical protein
VRVHYTMQKNTCVNREFRTRRETAASGIRSGVNWAVKCGQQSRGSTQSNTCCRQELKPHVATARSYLGLWTYQVVKQSKFEKLTNYLYHFTSWSMTNGDFAELSAPLYFTINHKRRLCRIVCTTLLHDKLFLQAGTLLNLQSFLLHDPVEMPR